MSNDVSLSTFPSGKLQGLAMLYLNNQDLSQLSPAQIAEKYEQAISEINDYYRQLNQKKHNEFYGHN